MEQKNILPGSPFPLGANYERNGFNFAIYSESTVLELVIASYDKPDELIAVPVKRTGSIWHAFYVTDATALYYAYKVLYKGSPRLALDPYAKLIHAGSDFGNNLWKEKRYEQKPLGIAFRDVHFDWKDDTSPRIDSKDLILYELHVRGLTRHASSPTAFKGTYQGVIDAIPHLQALGINAVELLPIHEFNESENYRVNPVTHSPLCNFWGYSTLSFFSPMQRYSHERDPLESLHEYKRMVQALHKAGIEVILDVVFNHTGEGNEEGPVISFKAFSESAYYLKNEHGHFYNYSGCGNTLNCNHPIVSDLIIDSLRYWVTELHVDGFRFDLASIFSRDQDGSVMHTSPLIERITQDPVLSHCKLIAEPWDAAGLHQVGHFYQSPWQGPEAWIEWNDDFRQVVRNFIKGTPGFAGRFATKLCGSEDIYGKGGKPVNSINYVTCHDGFTLHDLVSYNHKHNLENGEYNSDGMNNNDSWNSGHEGKTRQIAVERLRIRQMKNFCLALMCSVGVPMILMGDEYGHTKDGNNNTWCHDNERNWFLWDELEKNEELFSFWKKMISFRKNTPYFRRSSFFDKHDVQWHGFLPHAPNWSHESQFVAFSLDDLYIAFNASPAMHTITLPENRTWRALIQTSEKPPLDFVDEMNAPVITSHKIKLGPYSAILLRGLGQ